MANANVRYGVHFDHGSSRWYATRNGKRTWNLYSTYRTDRRGVHGEGDPQPVAPESPDTETGREELIDIVRGLASDERNRSSLREPRRGETYTGYGCPVTVFRKDGKVDKFKKGAKKGKPRRYPVKAIRSCSMAPFR